MLSSGMFFKLNAGQNVLLTGELDEVKKRNEAFETRMM